MSLTTTADPGFGIYIHWPFCARICPYCDFNVYAAKTRDEAPLIAAMKRDLIAHREKFGPRTVTSVFFGGGTPSLISGSGLGTLMETIVRNWDISPDAEVTLEANPNDINPTILNSWVSAGVNRLSIGVQSIDDQALAFLGRDHSASDARHAVNAALAHMPSVSVDLIYARPGQSLENWQTELETVLGFGAHHLSLYELTIEERTAFGRAVSRGEWQPMPDDEQADLYETTQVTTERLGFSAYEISNHAVSDRHQSRHNLTYWRSGEWLGIGPGAHGRITSDGRRITTAALRRPADYIEACKAGGLGWDTHSVLSPEDWANEALIMGLRTKEGVEKNRLEQLAGQTVDMHLLTSLREGGWLEPAFDHLILTPQGRLLADQIAQKLAFDA